MDLDINEQFEEVVKKQDWIGFKRLVVQLARFNGHIYHVQPHPLLLAIWAGQLHLVEFIIENGCYHVARGLSHFADHACRAGQLDILEYFVDKGFVCITPNEPMFFFAARYGHLHVIKYLVSKGAGVRIQSTALWWAAKNGHLEVVKYMVSEGADIPDCGPYVLWETIEAGHVEMVEYLIDHGCPFNTGVCPEWMSIAAQNGHIGMLLYLEKKCNFRADIGSVPLANWEMAEVIGRSLNTFLFLCRNVTKVYPLWQALDMTQPDLLKNRLHTLCNLMYGTVSVEPLGSAEKEWKESEYYDSNLGMLICSYLD